MVDAALNMETIIRRLERVECHNRRLRWAGGAVALLLAGVLLIGATTPPAGITVSAVKIVDGSGKLWASLDRDGLLFHDDAGKVQAVLRGDGVSFHDANEKPRAVLSGDGLSFHDGNEKLQAIVAGSRVLLYDADFKPLVGLAVDQQGAGSIVLSEAAGSGLRLTKSGPGLALSDAGNQVIWSTRH